MNIDWPIAALLMTVVVCITLLIIVYRPENRR